MQAWQQSTAESAPLEVDNSRHGYEALELQRRLLGRR